MSQYHSIYNIDRKEYISPSRLDSCNQLLSQVGWPASTSTVLFLLLANSNNRGGGDAPFNKNIGRWAGDRIVVQGDYAYSSDKGFVDVVYGGEEKSGWTEISDIAKDILSTTMDKMNE